MGRGPAGAARHGEFGGQFRGPDQRRAAQRAHLTGGQRRVGDDHGRLPPAARLRSPTVRAGVVTRSPRRCPQFRSAGRDVT
ncbi:hypothetical protein [Streptomyces laurentii]|uniref:hypothetical protein n=1 Tax=Streptomyces laurentii TaxID=39478 RepID=UPI0034105861